MSSSKTHMNIHTGEHFLAYPQCDEEIASAAAENVENENPLEVQNILEPIHLEGNTVNGRWKCPYCPYETKQKSNVTFFHIKKKHLGNNLTFYFLFYCKI